MNPHTILLLAAHRGLVSSIAKEPLRSRRTRLLTAATRNFNRAMGTDLPRDLYVLFITDQIGLDLNDYRN